MKNLITIILLLASNMVNAQYFQQRFNLNYSLPKLRNERCNSGIVTRYNLAGGNPASYYFAGIGTSYNDTLLTAPDNVADRMRFIQLNNLGTTVITNLGYQFSDVAGTPPFHSSGNSIAEIKNPNYTGGYVTVGTIKNNKITGASGIAGGTDVLFTHLNAAGTVIDAVRYDFRAGTDTGECIRKSVITYNGQPTWIICGESRQGTSNTICFVARVLVNGTIVWFNAYSFDPSGGAFNTSVNIAKQLCEDTEGNIYVVGTLRDVPAAATGTDALAFKLTPAGTVVWANSYHAASDDEFQAVRFTADGNIVAGGFTNFGAVAPVTSHMLIAKLSSATGALMFQDVLVESLNGNTYTSKCYDIIETAGPQYFLAGPGTLNNITYETMYKVNAGGFGINWYRYNRMNYNTGFGFDNSTAGAFTGIAYFSSMRNPDTPRLSDSHIMKTNYNGQTCNFCKAFPPKYIQVSLQVYPRRHLVQQDALLRKLAWQTFLYGNKLICDDASVLCNNASVSDEQDSSEANTVKAGTVQVSPNPVSSVLHLQFENIEPGNYNIVMVNRQGSIVLQKRDVHCDNSSTIDLNVSRLFSGFYLIRISNGVTTIEEKILKE